MRSRAATSKTHTGWYSILANLRRASDTDHNEEAAFFTRLSKDWWHVIPGQVRSRHWNFAVTKVGLLILGAIFCMSAYGQSLQPSPLPPLPPGKHYGHGCGLAELEVDYTTGQVTSARMLVSTGNKKNDDALGGFGAGSSSLTPRS